VNVRVLEVAQQELDEAVSYYNGQVAGLGDAFLLEAVRRSNGSGSFPTPGILSARTFVAAGCADSLTA
jgi:hypothetical protein